MLLQTFFISKARGLRPWLLCSLRFIQVKSKTLTRFTFSSVRYATDARYTSLRSISSLVAIFFCEIIDFTSKNGKLKFTFRFLTIRNKISWMYWDLRVGPITVDHGHFMDEGISIENAEFSSFFHWTFSVSWIKYTCIRDNFKTVNKKGGWQFGVHVMMQFMNDVLVG